MKNLNIAINCHSSICINDSIYFDPYNIKNKKSNAKIVFLTHTHYDHLDEASIKNVMAKTTIFVCTSDAVEQLVKIGIEKNNIVVVKVGDNVDVAGIKAKVYSAYNIGKQYHPKENGWVGYLVNVDGVDYYVCGDTDLTTELKTIKTDVLFVPIGGTFTMTATEAAQATNIIKPKLVVPMHYNLLVGDKNDEQTFVKNLDKTIKYKVLI